MSGRLRVPPADSASREPLPGRPSPAANAAGIKPKIHGAGADLLAWLALALVTLGILWPLGLTNRIPAGIDAFTYFAPYWDYRMAAFRAGQVPLWNPYLFLGVPFLANPQAAVLYPLHWPLSWLTAEQALVWSALLHTWLAAGFTYVLGRSSFGLSRPGAWLAGTVFGLGGYLLARVENINQLNALAWLPALLWLYDRTVESLGWRRKVRWGSALTVAIALCLLAGHTQSFFIVMVGLALYALAGFAGKNPLRSWRVGASENRSLPILGRGLASLSPLLAVVPAALLAAAQLLPTLELNGLGLRTGGLPFRQAVSFSLRPRLLAQTFLPPFGGRLDEAFGSEGYGEFVGYVGIVTLVLAGLAVVGYGRWLRDVRKATPAPLAPGDLLPGLGRIMPLLVLAATGVVLALGAYNPLYYLLWRFVPGFDLFRGPARWMALFALAAAVLAGIGLDRLATEVATTRDELRSNDFSRSKATKVATTKDELRSNDFSRSGATEVATTKGRRRLQITAIVIAAAGIIALVALQQPPPVVTLLGWIGAAALTAFLLRLSRVRPPLARWGLIALAVGELWLGSRALPFAQATAPLAAGLRNAPAALLAATADQPPAGRDRFLSLSDIRYDPGDLADLRLLQADRLSPAAIERLVRAAKQVEVIAPNLSLRYRLPAVDGYDGGVLPLARYVQLQGLFVPPEALLPDGRLREQLTQVPDDRLLDLTGVRFIITDKQRDLWADDVYYDLELSATLPPGETLTLNLTTCSENPDAGACPGTQQAATSVFMGRGAEPGRSNYPAFSATAIGIVAAGPRGVAGEPTGTLTVIGHDGERAELAFAPLSQDLATPTPAILPLPHPLVPKTLIVRNAGQEPLILRGLSLIDQRTGAHASVTVSQRGDVRRIHTGDVKIYERTQAPGRAWLVHDIRSVPDDTAALALLADPAFDPRTTAVVVGQGPAPLRMGPPGPDETVTTVAYRAEHIVLRTRAATPALLVIADTWYPGWEAAVDGTPVPLWRVNLLFRAVLVGEGEHEVTLDYRPATWRKGVALSVAGLALIGLSLLTTVFPSRRQGV